MPPVMAAPLALHNTQVIFFFFVVSREADVAFISMGIAFIGVVVAAWYVFPLF